MKQNTHTKNNLRVKRGFSFLEMIVVVAIITIMTMVMLVVSFRDRSKKEVEAVGREVTAAIRETQNNALTGRQQGSENLPCSFIFELKDGGGVYEIRGSYRELDAFCGDDEEPGSYTGVLLSENISGHRIGITGIDSEGNPSDFVVFTVPYGKFYDSSSGDSTGTEFVVTKQGEEQKYHICVHSTGLIEEIGFNSADQACAF